MRFMIVLILLAMLSPMAHAQTRLSNIVISPGIRIGGSSGDGGGPTFGFELSVIHMPQELEGAYYGFVVDGDLSGRGRKKLHFGIEGGLPFIGMEIGPTIVLEDGDLRTGLSITPYVGAFLFPFYSVTFLPDATLHDGGVYVKAPMRADGSPIFKFGC